MYVHWNRKHRLEAKDRVGKHALPPCSSTLCSILVGHVGHSSLRFLPRIPQPKANHSQYLRPPAYVGWYLLEMWDTYGTVRLALPAQ